MISLMKSVPQRVIIVRKVGTLSRSEQQRVVEQQNEASTSFLFNVVYSLTA